MIYSCQEWMILIPFTHLDSNGSKSVTTFQWISMLAILPGNEFLLRFVI